MWYHTLMVKTTVYLETDVVLSLRRMAESQGRSQAQLIRDALETYTRKTKRPKLPGIGEFDSGHSDTSERADEILKRAAKQRKWR
jgi:predicted transcriptional regulator